ncbi:MAG TPA: VOC family protein [Roseomonas sp.]|jgi:PhnB protein
MKISAYLFFNGNCEEAFTRYQQILGGRIIGMLRARGTPAEAQMPPDWQDKIMHACLDLGGVQLMASDAPPGCSGSPQGFAVQLAPETAEEAERIFAALAEGGTVRMPLERTFWAERFGMLVDRFGVPWMINYAPPAADGADMCMAQAETAS